MIAAGVNTKALSSYMGHASITITLDRYGHLLPGNEHEAANMLDTYLNHTTSAARPPSAAQAAPGHAGHTNAETGHRRLGHESRTRP